MSGGQILHDPFARALTSTKAGPPIATDDAGAGFAPGHVLVDAANGEVYVCRDATPSTAEWEKISAGAAAEVAYDPSGNALAATNVQDAIDEVVAGTINLFAGITSGATDITYDNSASGLASATLQLALDEVADALRPWSFRDEKGPGQSGGDVTANTTWTARDLNTSIGRTGGDVTLDPATGVVTFQPGLYVVDASVPSSSTRGHQLRLFNVTGATVLVYGTNSAANNSSITTTSDVVGYELDLRAAGGPTEVRIEARYERNVANGLGAAEIPGAPQIYSTMVVRKVARP